MKSKVYFTKEITPQSVLRLYKALGVTLEGKVAVKVHSGEPGNQNFLRPDFWRDILWCVSTVYDNIYLDFKQIRKKCYSNCFNNFIFIFSRWL